MARDGVPVDPRLAALVARHVDGELFEVTAECARIGTTPKTFYKYRKRFLTEGVDGFFPRSRRPHRNPRAVDTGVVDAVVLARKELDAAGWDAGADQIGFWLQDHPERWDSRREVPSRATINRILERRDLIARVPQRRPRRSVRRFEADAVNAMWQMDGFEWHLEDHRGRIRVVVLQVSDDCSRFDLALQAAKSENSHDVWHTVTTAMLEHGLPKVFLTDNGTAFSGRRRGWTSRLEENLTALGITTITSTPSHPQTCGKNERAHATVLKWLAKQPRAATLAELQAQLDTYRDHYNHQRRKKHLGGLTPAQRYALGPVDGPGTTPAPVTPVITRGKVSTSGCLGVNRELFSVGRKHAGQSALLIRQDRHIAIFIGNQLIAEVTLTGTRGYNRRSRHRVTELE
jgi:transposase InsO family protein